MGSAIVDLSAGIVGWQIFNIILVVAIIALVVYLLFRLKKKK
jgi:hypothetical protein